MSHSTSRVVTLSLALGVSFAVAAAAASPPHSVAPRAAPCLQDSAATTETLAHLAYMLDSSSNDQWFANMKVSAGLSGARFAGVQVVTDTVVCRAAIIAFGNSTMRSDSARRNFFSDNPSALVVRVVPNRLVVTDGLWRRDGRRSWVVFDSLWAVVEYAL